MTSLYLPKLQLLVRSVRNDEGSRSCHKIQSHGGNLRCVLVAVLDRKSTGHHVAVVDGLHLVDVVVVDPGVEHLVQVVQQCDHLQWRTLGCQSMKLDNITEGRVLLETHRVAFRKY